MDLFDDFDSEDDEDYEDKKRAGKIEFEERMTEVNKPRPEYFVCNKCGFEFNRTMGSNFVVVECEECGENIIYCVMKFYKN